MPLHRFTFRAMAADNELQLHTEDRAHAEAAARDAMLEVQRIEAKYSRYRPDSLLTRINASAGGAGVEIDDETRQLLEFAGACHAQSGGLFDATSGVLRRAWRFSPPGPVESPSPLGPVDSPSPLGPVDSPSPLGPVDSPSPLGEGRGGGQIPTDSDLIPLLALIGWERVVLEDHHVRLPDAGMEIDFGGFGKEYAVDRAGLRLREAGIESGMVNLAGDLTIVGPQPDGSAWRVGIRHPRKANTLIATLPVYSGAIATSGDNERYIVVDGVRHCHVLDPRTGRSARGFQSVTVHAPSCVVAGSASTIAMLKGAHEGLAWLEALALPHLCVLEDGTIVDRFA